MKNMDGIGTSFLSEHNARTYNNVHKMFSDYDSCAVVQPTGTGKSYIMMRTMMDFKNKWKIVIAPSRDFLDNLSKKKYWTSEKTLTITYTMLGVNSDNVKKILDDNNINPDDVGLIVIDEMHRTGAPKWGIGVKRLIHLCKNAKVLGLTATPKRYDEDRDMVEELFNGRLAVNMSIADAMQLGIIPNLLYTVGMHTLDFNINEIYNKLPASREYNYIRKMLDTYKDNWNFGTYFKETLSKYLNTKEKTGKHIVFTSSIYEADKLAPSIDKWFKEMFADSTVKTYVIHSKNNNKSSDIVDFFEENKENEIKVAVTVNMLNESFHSREIKSISMFRGTQSINVYMQQIGRALSTEATGPYIFDFVDNFNTIDELHKALTGDQFDKMIENGGIKAFIFKQFNDETNWLQKSLADIKTLATCKDKNVIKHIYNVVEKESTDGTIFTCRDKDFIYWAEYALKSPSILNIKDAEITPIINKLKTSIYISDTLGADWYFDYYKYINNQLDEVGIKKLKSRFNKMVMLNSLSKELREELAQHGLVSNFNQNLQKLQLIVDKNKLIKYKCRDKIDHLYELENEYKENGIQNINLFDIYKSLSRIETEIGVGEQRFTEIYVGDAALYWIWKNLENKYKAEFEEVKEEYNKYCYFDTFLSNCKKGVTRTPVEDVNNVDLLLNSVESIDELPRFVKDMLEWYKITDLDVLKSKVVYQLILDDDLKIMRERLEYNFTLDTLNGSKLKEQCEFMMDKVKNKLNTDKLKWSSLVLETYNKVIKICETGIIYYNNDRKPETEWIWEYARDIRNNYILTKSKKLEVNCSKIKIQAAINRFSTQESILEAVDLSDADKSEFKKQYEIYAKTWNEKYKASKKEDINLFISLLALSKTEAVKQDTGTNLFSQRISKDILTLLDGLSYSEKLSKSKFVINADDCILNIERCFSLMSDDAIWIMSRAFSKRTRERFTKMYKQYLENSILIKTEVERLIDAMSDTDTQLLYDTKNSEIYMGMKSYLKFLNAVDELC